MDTFVIVLVALACTITVIGLAALINIGLSKDRRDPTLPR
jgi:hypothetical protein